MSAQTLRDVAAFLMKQADEMEGKSTPSGFDQNVVATWWPAMKAQFAAEDESVASEREIGSIVTAYQPVIQAAQRERWPSNLGPGNTFWLGNYKTASELRVAIFALMQTEEYKRWAAHPDNVHLVPKAPPVV